MDEFIGVPGWLDTFLDLWFYQLAKWLLAIGLATTMGGRSRRPATALAVVIPAIPLIMLAEFVTGPIRDRP